MSKKTQGPNKGANKASSKSQKYREFVPLTIRRVNFVKGKPPKMEEELRHCYFNNWAYKQMAEALGLDLVGMSKAATASVQNKAKNGEEVNLEQVEEQVSSLLDVDVDNLEQTAVLVWGALITESKQIDEVPLTVDDCLKMLTGNNTEEMLTPVLEALAYYGGDTEKAEVATGEDSQGN